MNSYSFWKSSSVSPGNPTITVVLITTPGILSLNFFIVFFMFCPVVCLFILFRTLSEMCCIGISKYLHIFSFSFTTFINSSVISSGYVYKNLIHFRFSILQSLCNNSASIGFPYTSIPYLDVSCAIKIISLLPDSTIFLVSSSISSIFLLTYFPLMYGIAQYVHLLSQPSAILT